MKICSKCGNKTSIYPCCYCSKFHCANCMAKFRCDQLPDLYDNMYSSSYTKEEIYRFYNIPFPDISPIIQITNDLNEIVKLVNKESDKMNVTKCSHIIQGGYAYLNLEKNSTLVCGDCLRYYHWLRFNRVLIGKSDNNNISFEVVNHNEHLYEKFQRTLKENEKVAMSEPNYDKSTAFWMIYREGGNSPTAKHSSFALAEVEAKRLAGLKPNVEFFILEVQTSVICNLICKNEFKVNHYIPF